MPKFKFLFYTTTTTTPHTKDCLLYLDEYVIFKTYNSSQGSQSPMHTLLVLDSERCNSVKALPQDNFLRHVTSYGSNILSIHMVL